jgi:hypothetical protein
MELIMRPKIIDISEWVLPELGANSMHTRSVKGIHIQFALKLCVNMLIFSVIQWSKS